MNIRNYETRLNNVLKQVELFSTMLSNNTLIDEPLKIVPVKLAFNDNSDAYMLARNEFNRVINQLNTIINVAINMDISDPTTGENVQLLTSIVLKQLQVSNVDRILANKLLEIETRYQQVRDQFGFYGYTI